MNTGASDLVAEGIGLARIRFGVGGAPVRCELLAERGARLFSDATESATIGVLMTNDEPTVEILLGAMRTGVRLVSLPLPSRGGSLEDYTEAIRSICSMYSITEILARDDLCGLIEAGGLSARSHSDRARCPLAASLPTGFELVQFSSGTTGPPIPTALGDAALGSNLSAIVERVDPQPGDVTVSWLPLSHDMGLVGMVLASIVSCSPGRVGAGEIALLDPESFLRQPSLGPPRV